MQTWTVSLPVKIEDDRSDYLCMYPATQYTGPSPFRSIMFSEIIDGDEYLLCCVFVTVSDSGRPAHLEVVRLNLPSWVSSPVVSVDIMPHWSSGPWTHIVSPRLRAMRQVPTRDAISNMSTICFTHENFVLLAFSPQDRDDADYDIGPAHSCCPRSGVWLYDKVPYGGTPAPLSCTVMILKYD